jgi:hypothetical protein
MEAYSRSYRVGFRCANADTQSRPFPLSATLPIYPRRKKLPASLNPPGSKHIGHTRHDARWLIAPEPPILDALMDRPNARP